MDSRRFASIRRALAHWYIEYGRHDLPWRETRDAYAVLVSEVMLQQTQVARVLPAYERWLRRWPTIAALAAASPADVIEQWAGLGYNRRALNLHRAAVATVDRFAGQLPSDSVALRSLPGVGDYTAAAIACFASETRTVVLDTNISRVICRCLLGVASPRDAAPDTIATFATSLLPRGRTRDHNLALMDLGATVCTARSPHCDVCPLGRHCAWLAAGSPPGQASTANIPKFETTARFARGRIVDALRSGPLTTEELSGLLPASHREPLPAYLAALQREGLVTTSGPTWRLPKS
jgi:A/G-specific adenine glycosylase